MGQREDVQASLLRGDSRDGMARRKVADAVKDVVTSAVDVEYGHAEHRFAEDVGKATAAVVLASDLRAPADGFKFGAEDRVSTDWAPFMTVKRARLANVERLLAECAEAYDASPGSDWHERGEKALTVALAEVRAMIDGEPTAPDNGPPWGPEYIGVREGE